MSRDKTTKSEKTFFFWLGRSGGEVISYSARGSNRQSWIFISHRRSLLLSRFEIEDMGTSNKLCCIYYILSILLCSRGFYSEDMCYKGVGVIYLGGMFSVQNYVLLLLFLREKLMDCVISLYSLHQI